MYEINGTSIELTRGDSFYCTVGATDKLYCKKNGSWVEVVKAYKKVNGSWVLQSDLTTVFQSGTNYIKGETS